ncbi:MAG: PHP domain-containing protein [Pedosphaera sp.]|nr:PHP domain-containing protein [Pedosphaera sp.]
MHADLHLHTFFSDGTYSPEELVAHASRVGLSAIALTDHDTVEGCARTAASARSAGIEFITGCEFTVGHGDRELHLLGYFLDLENAALQTALTKYQAVRRDRIEQMIGRLNALGIPLREETVTQLVNCQAPGRPHLARALVKQGYCTSLDQAFQAYLKRGRPAWVPKDKMSSADAIQLVHAAGGVAVMAHPGINHMDDVIPELAQLGLDGLECFYTRHSTAMTERYLAMAEAHGLLATGGSDCHGENKGRPLMGSVRLPIEYVARLKVAAGIAA